MATPTGMNTTQTNTTARQTYFNRKLLKTVTEMLQMAPLCTKYSLPKNQGTTTIRMFKRAKAEKDSVKALTEGTPDSNWSRTNLTGIDVALKQYGDKAKISDVASETDLFNQLNIECKRMGEACALFVDYLIMEEAVKNATKKIYAGATDFATLKAATASAATTMNCSRVLAVAQFLKKMRAPKFSGGYYVAVMTPEQVYDLMQDDNWKTLNVHNRGGKAIYNNEVGMIHGVRILETTAGWTESSAENTYDAAGGIYNALFMGEGALGTVDLAGGKSARKPSFIHVRGADKSDPLDQFQTVGWKGYFAQKLLEPDWLVDVRTKTLMPSV